MTVNNSTHYNGEKKKEKEMMKLLLTTWNYLPHTRTRKTTPKHKQTQQTTNTHECAQYLKYW
jgi:hypothetical protein